MNKITIGLDYDGTVTSDPVGFAMMAELLRARGHTVIVVTMRYQSECLNDPAFVSFVQNVDAWMATGREAKRPFCDSVGVKIHVWIDDNPIAVEKSAAEVWGLASPEGSVVTEIHDNCAPSTIATMELRTPHDTDTETASHRVNLVGEENK